MRVAVFAESFLPQHNGVTNSVVQTVRRLETRGHEVLVIAARPPLGVDPGPAPFDSPVLRVPAVSLPGYPEVRVAVAGAAALGTRLERFRPDVVHLASPFALGGRALAAAAARGIPTVAVYQTDVPGYARRYGVPGAEPALARRVQRIHSAATLTLAPSAASEAELARLGVERVRHWARGVDAELFHPGRRDEALRRRLAPDGGLLVGTVGRLAPEKQLDDLAALAGIPELALVLIGDGPERARLVTALPEARFLGRLEGVALAEAVASLDLLVHPGEHESFGQAIQEALASGVPVVATGRGGPLDLVENSRTGWLYAPGELGMLRERVLDLAGDDAKRRAFGRAAREAVLPNSWDRLVDELLGHYADAVELGRAGDARFLTGAARPRPAAPVPHGGRRPDRFAALGDSLTEGLDDTSRQAPGEYRGWADRLAMLLAQSRTDAAPLRYANLAVRSRRIRDVVEEQVPAAIGLGADFATVLVGGNDLVKWRARPERLVAELEVGVAQLRAAGVAVLLVTAFTPPNPAVAGLRDRFVRFNRGLRALAERHGCRVLDFWDHPEFLESRAWSPDRVHLSAHGHRMLAYRAAAALGVPDAAALGLLDDALHEAGEEEPMSTARWMRRHLLPWLWRRARGRTAGDGLVAKHRAFVELRPGAPGVRVEG